MRASEYLLEGSKETLRTMRKNHDGHYLEVTGTLKVPKDGPTPVSLVVSSYRDLDDQCHER